MGATVTKVASHSCSGIGGTQLCPPPPAAPDLTCGATYGDRGVEGGHWAPPTQSGPENPVLLTGQAGD